MDERKLKNTSRGNFNLSKWFLDFVDPNGTAMIFYAAKLTWYARSICYSSWLRYDSGSGVTQRFRFSDVRMPHIENNKITWNDSKFGISGTWESLAKMVQDRIFDSDDGYLDWKCHQPASRVQLSINGKSLVGEGYAEELILTTVPWKIPMDELRWGHYGSEENHMVWIELKEKTKRQWLWLNGDRIENCIIEDECIRLPEKDLLLNLDQGVLLESEKKIFKTAGNIVRYIPGFSKAIPLNFLMADEHKWLSNGQLQIHNKTLCTGNAIHELVNFKTA